MDFFNSFFQNVKDKLTSPFFGTLSFILIFHHWEFWYTLFNFDKNCTLSEKVSILRLMSSREFSFKELALDAVFAIIFVIGGYVVIFLTRALSLAFDHRIMTWLTRQVVSKNVVLLETHKNVVAERDEYADKYEEQRRSVRSMSKDNDDQSLQIQSRDELINKNNVQINSLNINIADINEKYKQITIESSLLEQKLKKTNNLLDRTKNELSVRVIENDDLLRNAELLQDLLTASPDGSIFDSIDKFPLFIKQKVSDLHLGNDWNTFLSVKNHKLTGGIIPTRSYGKLREYGLVKSDESNDYTPLGQIIATHAQALDN